MTTVHDSPIFVVGAARSGTTLMQSVLSNHPRVRISGETHYFDDLRVTMRGREQSPLSAQDAKRCEDYFLSLAHRPYGHGGDPKRSRIDRKRLYDVANGIGVGADAYFEAFCRLNADIAGKVRWGEKTPRHVFRIPEIVERYPGTQIICMVRDPRAVVASYRDYQCGDKGGFDFERDPELRAAVDRDRERARKSYNILIASLFWRSAVQGILRARVRFGAERVYIQRYEDLIAAPVETLTRLCQWLSIDYSPCMLEVPLPNSSFSTSNKRAGVSQEPARRWREKLSDTEIGVTQACCGSLMKEIGYTREPVKIPIFALAWHCIALPVVTFRIVRVNRGRMVDIPDYIWRRLRLAIGYRCQVGKSVQSR